MLKSYIEVPYVMHMKVQVLSFNMNLKSSPLFVRRPSYSFPENLGEPVKGHPAKKLKLLIKVPSVAHLKVQVLSLNMNLNFSP